MPSSKAWFDSEGHLPIVRRSEGVWRSARKHSMRRWIAQRALPRSLSKKGTDYSVPKRKYLIPGVGPRRGQSGLSPFSNQLLVLHPVFVK